MHRGWIKLWRCISDHRLWPGNTSRDFTKFEAFIDLMMMAAHCPRSFTTYIPEREYDLRTGQLVSSYTKLGKRWNWSKGKAKRFLERLEKKRDIDITSDGVFLTITLLEYELYQKQAQPNGQGNGPNNEPNVDGQQTTSGHQRKNYKNDQALQNYINKEGEEENDPRLEELISYWSKRWQEEEGNGSPYPMKDKDELFLKRVLDHAADIIQAKTILEVYLCDDDHFYSGHTLSRMDADLPRFVAAEAQRYFSPDLSKRIEELRKDFDD